MKILILVLAVLILVLAGCSGQTIVKFQCADGSFVDSAADCPAKTETKVETQTVKKISNLSIQEITEMIRTTKFEKDASFCDNPSNYNLEKISLTPYSIESGNSFSELFEMGKYGSNQ